MEQFDEYNAIMVATAIGALICIFICALIALLFIICRRQRQIKRWSRFDDPKR